MRNEQVALWYARHWRDRVEFAGVPGHHSVQSHQFVVHFGELFAKLAQGFFDVLFALFDVCLEFDFAFFAQ